MGQRQVSTGQPDSRIQLALIVTAGAILGALTTVVLGEWDRENEFLGAQLAYSLPTILALTNVATIVARYRWLGLAHPITMLTLGLMVFLSTGPLLNPANSTTASGLYSSPDRYWPVVTVYTLGLLALMLGSMVGRRMNLGWALTSPSSYRFDAGRMCAGLSVCSLAGAGILILLAYLNATSIFIYASSQYSGDTVAGFQHPLSSMLYLLLRFTLVAVPILAAVTLSLSTGRRSLRLISLSLLAASVYFQAAAGTRYFLVYAAGGAILVWFGLSVRGTRWWASSFRLNTRILLALVLVAIIAFIVFQMGYIRTRGGIAALASVGIAIPSIQTFVDYGIDTNPPLEEMLTAVPERRPFIYGESFLSAFVAFIPRFMWATKPMTAWAYMEGYTTMPELVINPNAAWTIIGELYLNYGLPGIALGMVFVGIAGELWARRYVASSASASAATFYFMSLPASAFLARGDFQAAAGTVLYPMIIVFVVMRASRIRVVPGQLNEMPGS